MTNVNTAAAVKQAIGMPRQRLHRWRRKLLGDPDSAPRAGNACVYSEKDMTAIEAAQRLRYRGFAVSECRPTVEWIRYMPRTVLNAMLAAGRKYLVVLGGQVMNPPQLLMRRAEIFENPHFDLASMFAVDRPFAIIDVADCLSRVAEKLEAKPPGVNSTGSSSSQTKADGEVAA